MTDVHILEISSDSELKMTKSGFGCMTVSSQHVGELILPSKPCVQPDPSL